MRFLITGSRNWSNPSVIEKFLNAMASRPNSTMVVGDCPTGADSIASSLWTGKSEVYMAFWNQQGNAAGPIRNQRMVDSGNILVGGAFLSKKSHSWSKLSGTEGCIKMALKKGITMVVFDPSGASITLSSLVEFKELYGKV